MLLASTADKIVALTSLLRRAHSSGDPDAFFTARPASSDSCRTSRTFTRPQPERVPASMTDQLGHVLDLLHQDTATARARLQEPGP